MQKVFKRAAIAAAILGASARCARTDVITPQSAPLLGPHIHSAHHHVEGLV